MSSQAVPEKKQQELQSVYSRWKDQLQLTAKRIGDIEQELEEYKLVIDTLGPLPGDRKCFQMVNGFLMEKNVEDVRPAVQTKSEALRKELDQLAQIYVKKQGELETWKKDNNVKIMQA